jgi:hypothetical protein
LRELGKDIGGDVDGLIQKGEIVLKAFELAVEQLATAAAALSGDQRIGQVMNLLNMLR